MIPELTIPESFRCPDCNKRMKIIKKTDGYILICEDCNKKS